MTMLRRTALWVVLRIPLGSLAPYLMGFALRTRGRRVR